MKSKQKKNEFSFTQKCILTSNALYEKDKDKLNTLFFIPLVKLYTSNVRQGTFSYTGIKGGLFLLIDAEKQVQNLYIRIYDSMDYSLKFNLEINAEAKKTYIKSRAKFLLF